MRHVEPTTKRVKGKLTAKQRLFIECYLADNSMNGAAAAREAGYSNPSNAAYNLSKNKLVAAEIGRALQKRMEACRVTAEEVLNMLSTALFLDPLELFDISPDGVPTIRSLADVPLSIRQCIKELDIKTTEHEGTTTTHIEIKLMDKDKALALAMKHCDLLQEQKHGKTYEVDASFLASLVDEVEKRNNVVDGRLIEDSSHKKTES